MRKDPAWKYARLQNEQDINTIVCGFCSKVTKGGVYRVKQHLVGGYSNVLDCRKCPDPVKEEIKEYMSKKKEIKEQRNLVADIHAENYGIEDEDEDEDEVVVSNSNKRATPSGSTLKKPRQKGPMDAYFTPNPEMVVQSRQKDKRKGKQTTMNAAYDKEMRETTIQRYESAMKARNTAVKKSPNFPSNAQRKHLSKRLKSPSIDQAIIQDTDNGLLGVVKTQDPWSQVLQIIERLRDEENVKKCRDINSNAQRMQLSKRLKSPLVGLATIAVNNNGMLGVDESQDSRVQVLPISERPQDEVNAKKCGKFNSNAQQRRPSKRLKSPLVGRLATIEDNDNGALVVDESLDSRGQVFPILEKPQDEENFKKCRKFRSNAQQKQCPKRLKSPLASPATIEENDNGILGVGESQDSRGQILPISERPQDEANVKKCHNIPSNAQRKRRSKHLKSLATIEEDHNGMLGVGESQDSRDQVLPISEMPQDEVLVKKGRNFRSNAQRKRCSKRLKSPSVGLGTTIEDNDNGMLGVDKSQDSRGQVLPISKRPQKKANVKKCLNFPSNAQRKLRSKHLKSSLVGLGTTEDNDDGMLSVDSSQDSGGQVSPILEWQQDEESFDPLEQIMKQPPKKVRGPTKMKMSAIDELNKVDITYNEYGQPIGKTSIGLASFLGTLVRDVVPVTLQDWRKLSTELKEILWTSIQSRYNTKEPWEKTYLFQKMGNLWRAGKSRIVSKIQMTSSDEELVQLKPTNVQSMSDWLDFVKEKKSEKFMATSEKFKSMKKKQLPHTCSRKGYARLAEEMKNTCSGSSSVTRVALWAKAHRRKDGNPVNSRAAETLERIERIYNEETNTSSTNVNNDVLSKVLGPDRGNHVKGLGFGILFPKLSTSTQRENYVKLEDKCENMEREMTEMRSLISRILKVQRNTSEQVSMAANEPVINKIVTDTTQSSPLSISPNNVLRKCKLLDWCGTGEIVAEGRWSSSDPKVLVHHVPLGPHANKVWVDLPIKHDAFLWRPNTEMSYIKDAVDERLFIHAMSWPQTQLSRNYLDSLSRHVL